MRRCGRGNHYKLYPHQRERLKRAEIEHQLKSQHIFSGSSQKGWREPFDFPTEISGFPI